MSAGLCTHFTGYGEHVVLDAHHHRRYPSVKLLPPTRRMATKRAKKTDVDVVSASSAELRKAVEAIAIQPKSGKITLLTRKLFNVLLAVAQQADDSATPTARCCRISSPTPPSIRTTPHW